MSDKKKDLSAQSRREDEALNRTLLWIGGAAVLILVLLFCNRYYVNYRTTEVMFAATLSKVLPIVAILGFVGCAAGVFLAIGAGKKGRSMKWPTALAVLCGGFALCVGLVWRYQGTGVQFLCGLILAVAVLALVYYLFQREFFAIALVTGVGMAGLWMVRRAGGAHAVVLYGYLVVAALVLVIVAWGARKLQASGGVWKGKNFLSKNAAYGMIYITCALIAALLIAAVVAGAGVAYYLMFPAVGWLVVMAVYFTVKLM